MPQVYRAIRPMFQLNQWRIFPDDLVQVLAGPDKGLTGKVLEVIKDPRRPEVIVEGMNLRKKKIYTGLKEDDFFVVTMEAPLHYSQVTLVDPVSKEPVRAIFRYKADGTRVRIGIRRYAKTRKLGPELEEVAARIMPIAPRKDDKASKYGLCGAKDTPEEEVRRVTFDPMAPFPFQPPNRRPSRLPFPTDSDQSVPSLPASKGIWATPAWFGAPNSLLSQEDTLAQAQPQAAPLPLAATPRRPGVFGALRQYSTVAASEWRQRQLCCGTGSTLVWQWIIGRQHRPQLPVGS